MLTMKSTTLKVLALAGLVAATYLPAAAQNQNPSQFYEQMRSLNGKALGMMTQLTVDESDATVSGLQPASTAPSAPFNWLTNAQNLTSPNPPFVTQFPQRLQPIPGPDGEIVPAGPWSSGPTPEDFLRQIENLPGPHRDPGGHEVDDAPENESPQLPSPDTEFDVSSTSGFDSTDSSFTFDNSDGSSTDVFSDGAADNSGYDSAPSLPDDTFSVASDSGGDDPGTL
jgi:hypothetical protein